MMARSFLCAVVVIGLASVASAAPILYVGLQYAGSYDAGFDMATLPNSTTPLGDGTNRTTIRVDGTHLYHAFNMLVNVSGLASDQDVVYLQYGGAVTGGASFFDGCYSPNNPTIDPPAMGSPSSNAPAASTFYMNGFNFSATTFYQDVMRGTGTGFPTGNTYGDYAAYINGTSAGGLGENYAYNVGTLYVMDASVDGTAGLMFSANPGVFKVINGNIAGAATDISFETYPTYSGIGDSLVFTTVPEPSTLALLAAGLVGMVAYAWRKRK